MTIAGDGPVRLDLAGWSQLLAPTVAVDTVEVFDRLRTLRLEEFQQCEDAERVTWTERSTLWTKRHHLDVHRDHLLFHSEVHGSGSIDTVRFFDAIHDADFVEHFALTKHFNDRGQTRPREYSTGSPIGFRHLLCPEPNAHARQFIKSFEYAQISVHADLDHRGGNFVANPGLLAFAAAGDLDKEWLVLGLAVRPGEHHFSEFEYLGGDTFSLNLNCWGVPDVEGTFYPPAVVLVPGATAEDALNRYVRVLRDSGTVPRPTRSEATWWSRPIVCGWGHQCYQADLFRVRSSPERPRDNAAYTLCTQLNYRDIVETLDCYNIPWGTLAIDARWFLTGGLKNLDVGRWPDLRGFVDSVHRRGRRVLLWWSPWDPEGVPDADCVRYLPGEDTRQNRPGRLSKFGVPHPGKKIAVDITMPRVRERIREQVRVALSAEPGCWDADGLKIDHLSAAPGIYGMAFPDGSGRLFGIEAAHQVMALIYEAAKDVKPDALIVGQSPNPYFAGVQDMVRLGDIYSHQAATVLPEMRFRASMARIADSSCLIDSDGWPMPSLAAWREYVREQSSIGVPSLYYLTHLDTTGEPLTTADHALIRSSWRGL
ncbi:MAG: TIM-barrel domain-containing protein [Pseudonocardiaceae bacterium]